MDKNFSRTVWVLEILKGAFFYELFMLKVLHFYFLFIYSSCAK